MEIFVTSDQHFGHENIIKYCDRPFLSVEDMNEAIIANWNAAVKPDDTVITLGDMFCGGTTDSMAPILDRLNGDLIYVRGNHCSPQRLEVLRSRGIVIHDIYYLSYKGLFFVFNHFPQANPEFLKMIRENNSETVICHGHVHNSAPHFDAANSTFNCCVDVTDFAPVNIRTLSNMIRGAKHEN